MSNQAHHRPTRLDHRAGRPRRTTPASSGTRPSSSVRIPAPADALASLGVVVQHALGLLQDRRTPLERRTVHEAIDHLRHRAHEVPHPALRAAVHVACSHLSAGNLDEARDALSTAAQLCPAPRPRPSR